MIKSENTAKRENRLSLRIKIDPAKSVVGGYIARIIVTYDKFSINYREGVSKSDYVLRGSEYTWTLIPLS